MPQIPIIAALYFFLFAAFGAEVSFLPHVLATAGLPSEQVGFVLAVGTMTQVFVAPIVGTIADRSGIRLALFVAAVAAAASLVLLLGSSSRVGAATLAYVAFAMATAPLNPLVDAIAVPICQRLHIPYGRVRGVGSVGFMTGILLSSAIASRLGTGSTIVTAAVCFVLLTAVLPAVTPVRTRTEDDRPAGAIGSLVRIRPFRRVLLVAAMIIGSGAMSDVYAVTHWRTIGIAMDTIGYMLALAVVSEFLVFAILGPKLIDRFGPSACAVIGAVVGALRWVLLAESTSVWLVLLAQLLHGLPFALVHLACMQTITNVAPGKSFATAQSLYSICSNAIASAIVTLAGGALFGIMGGRAFWLAAALCVLALPFALRLDRGVAPAPCR